MTEPFEVVAGDGPTCNDEVCWVEDTQAADELQEPVAKTDESAKS